MTARVVLASNDASVLGQVTALAGEAQGVTLLEAVDDFGRLARLVDRADPEVILLHDVRGTVPTLETVRNLSAASPEVGIVVLSGEQSPDLLRSAMQAGARDVVEIPLSLEDLEASVAAAAAWTATMRGRVAGEQAAAAAAGRAGTLLTVAGAKGGVGATTIALQLALAVRRAQPERSVCVVDLDLRGGDVRAFLDLPYQRSIADLVDVSDELSLRQLEETLFNHDTGLRVLLAPDEVEQAEDVGVVAARNVLAAVRSRHDLVIVDVGASVSDAAAVAFELADRILVVATPDVVALRGVRRLTELWQRLEIRGAPASVVLNRTSRKREVQPDLARRVSPAPLAETTIPASFSGLETAVNTGRPDRVEDKRLRSAYEALAQEVGALARAEPSSAGGADRGRLLARLGEQRGQSSAEFLGILPVVILICFALWQMGLLGYSFFITGHAAREGARALATSEDEAPRIREDVPASWRDGLRCDIGKDRVKVSVAVPIVIPGVDSPWRISSSAATTVEKDGVRPIDPGGDAFKPKRAKDDACANDPKKSKKKPDPKPVAPGAAS